MKITLPFTEAVALATAETPLPALVESLTCEGSTVHADIDLREVPTDSRAMKLAFAAGGTIEVTARLDAYSDGVATIVVTAHARGLPAHKLLPYLVAPVNSAVKRAGLPDGLVSIERGEEGESELRVDVQKAVESRVEGLTITGLRIRDAVIRVEATVGEFHRLG